MLIIPLLVRRCSSSISS